MDEEDNVRGRGVSVGPTVWRDEFVHGTTGLVVGKVYECCQTSRTSEVLYGLIVG